MKCETHSRYKGGTPPSKRDNQEGRTCKSCWEIYYGKQGIPYNPETMRSLAKVHTRYYQSNGKQVQGITTVIGNHNGDKGGMVYAAWKLGLEGQDYKKEWEQKADAGTLAHEMIRAHLLEIEHDFSRQWGKSMIEQAQVAFEAFLRWKSQYKVFVPIMIEQPLVSDELPYGATLDLYAMLDDRLAIVDFKTGKAIYWNHEVQLAGIKRLLLEHNHPVDDVICLHIKKGEETVDGVQGEPQFSAHLHNNLEDHIKWFELICQANPYFLRVAKGWR